MNGKPAARRSRRWLGRVGLVLLLGTLPAPSRAASSWEALLDHLVGHWRMTGTVRGKPAVYTLTGERTLQKRFVELHMKDVHVPPEYEARVFIGADSAGHRYIAHWMDNFGAAYSIPHATGEARGDTIELTFRYEEGALRDRFVYDRNQDAWRFVLETPDSAGAWHLFADYDVRRVKPPRGPSGP